MNTHMGFTLKEVNKHKKKGDLWIIINNKIYDISEFLKYHPGGKKILLKNGGNDISNTFPMIKSHIRNWDRINEQLQSMFVGYLIEND
jgi:cytochrome b involved in lipid metabolism